MSAPATSLDRVSAKAAGAAVQLGAVFELTVGAVGHGGFCIARHEGQAVFVRYALPGEQVRARVTEVRPSYLRADAVDVLRPSPDRVPPPCPHARPGRCGGCDWQHASLDAQRRLKADVVRDQFRRLARLDVAVTVEPVPGDEDGFGWRTRVAFAVDGHGRAGLRRHRSHEVHPIGTCLIAHPAIRDLEIPQLPWPGAETVEAVVSARGERALVVTPRRGRRAVVDHPDPAVALARTTRQGLAQHRGEGHVTEDVAGHAFHVGLSSFWQVHPMAATTLATAALGALAPRPGERAVDLYAGAGLFAVLLADAVGPAGAVAAVELAPSAVDDAVTNLAAYPQAFVRRQRVDATAVAEVVQRLGGVDIAVLDPPRTGAGPAVMGALAAAGPRAIAYVACDPAALARDVAAAVGAGYRLASLRAFDAFPMTAHVECVALLTPASDDGA